MDIEKTLLLFESLWFETEILNNRSSSSKPKEINRIPDEKIQENSSKQRISAVVNHRRSVSDDLNLNLSESFSPNSVLSARKLRTIFSGKEVQTSEESKERNCGEEGKRKIDENRGRQRRRRRRRKQSMNKSLSDLEFEEVKGFMDLGFVFTEKDKDTELAEMIPGIQRFFDAKDQKRVEESKIARPYLSEAWEVYDGKNRGEENKNQFVLDLRFPDLSNEMNMKDNLRLWAHTVASAVR